MLDLNHQSGDSTPRLYDIVELPVNKQDLKLVSSAHNNSIRLGCSFTKPSTKDRDLSRENKNLKKKLQLLKSELSQMDRIKQLVNQKEELIHSLNRRLEEEKEESEELAKNIETLWVENQLLQQHTYTLTESNSVSSNPKRLKETKHSK